MSARLRSSLAPLVGQAALVFLLLFGLLHGGRRDFHVPLQFSGDALEYLMQVKGTIDHGWWWTNASLSAPGTFDQIAYPSNTNVDQAIVWVVHLFTRDAPLCINVSWMLMVALAAPIATLCLIRLGLSRAIAYTAGVLYALSPYALYRNIEHLALVIYLVPIPCTVALLIATHRLGPIRSASTGLLLLGCALLGFNYAYYAFFGCFVIGAAACISFLDTWNRRALASGALFVATISVATLVNLAPSFHSWATHGRPIIIPDKTPAEAEVYGLKLRQLVSPVFDYEWPPVRSWIDRERAARYPLETENARSRLGLLATVGFLLMLGGVLAPRAVAGLSDGPLFASAGRLTVAAVLLATVGGFGSLFNLLVSPEIRAYNRVCPFLAFFAWVGLALALQKLLGPASGAGRRRWALAGVLVIGVFDQSHAAAPVNRDYESIRDDVAGLRWFVGSLEPKLSPGALVFQLPVTTYLNDTGHVKMRPYDHIRPYVVSRTIHWSYPALSNSIVRWQQAVGRLPAPDLAAALDVQGFSAIVVDRYGYEDGGLTLLTAIGATATPNAVLAESGRYVAIDLRLVPQSHSSAAWLPRVERDFTPATAGVPSCDGTTAQAIDRIGAARAPFPDTPVPVADSGELTVRGWAVDDPAQRPAGDVDLVVDDRAFATFYGVERLDVAARLHQPVYSNTGFLARVPAAGLTAGLHRLSVRVLAADRHCSYRSPDVVIVR